MMGTFERGEAPLFNYLPLSFQERGIKGVRARDNGDEVSLII
jgi:hypothetical protein